ncbi:MAG TPA: ABC transporter permease [Solirubrobacteraceae bacterium]|nr:ABC transporter permease [Solirubrobacteraceae bacterium]
MSGALRDALAGVRARRGRAALSALGIALAAAMLAVAATVGYELHTGFSRSARAADLPDIIARFDGQPASSVASRIRALPDVAAFSLRDEVANVGLNAGSHSAANGVVEVIDGGGPRGYAIVAGHDISSAPGNVMLEQGVARAWGLSAGETIEVAGLGPQRIAGLTQSPDNVAYPLTTPRLYAPAAALEEHAGEVRDPTVDLAEIWLRDPAELNAVLVQARTTSYGLHDLSIVTRSGVRVLIDEAAGIVIALLVALSLVALVTAAVMLATSARAEVQRRLRAIGIRRAIGAAQGYVAAVSALEALLVAVPAAAVGVAVGALLAAGPSARLLSLLNETGPGAQLASPLAGCFAVGVAIPTLAGVWPAWRAAARPTTELLRGAELQGYGRRHRRARPAGRRFLGLIGLGATLVSARRVRLATTLALLAVSCAFVLLMLALASELSTLANDPAALGKRYQLSVSLPAAEAARVRRLPGIEAVAPRYELSALDSFSLGEVIDVIAYPGDHTTFEDPPLVGGRRLRGSDEAEVGTGLADVLGLDVGSTLALALPSGGELRLRVAGVVSSLEHDGRIAYVPAAALLARDPGAPEQLAVRLDPGASASVLSARLRTSGVAVASSATVTGNGQTLVAALSALLRAIAVVDWLVCLYALLQALALTAHERRGAIALLRACGAGAGSVRMLLAGAALAVLVPAALVGIVLERLLLGPAMAAIAAGYASLPLSAGPLEITVLLLGLALLATGAVWWVARRTSREPIARGLA